MKDSGKNIIASVRQRLINLSKTRGEDPNLIFIRYAIERLLYRISCSRQSDKFILKGAMLFATWTDKPYRPTKESSTTSRTGGMRKAPKRSLWA